MRSSEPAYPRFSFVGAPNRDMTYDLTISASDMDPITLTDIGPTTGTVQVVVPAGPDRLIDMRARNDVYSGSTVHTLRPGRTETVQLRLLPGPVFLDRGGDGVSDPGLIQIRDLGVPVASVSDEQSGLGRFAPFAGPIHLETGFSADGTLWSLVDGEVKTIEVYGAWDDLVDGSIEDPIELGALDFDPITADVSTTQDLIAVGGTGGAGIALFNATGEIIEEFPGDVDFAIESVTGVSIAANDLLYAVGEVTDGTDTHTAVMRFDTAAGTENYTVLPGNQSAPEYDDGLNPPWADIRVIGNNVFVVSAAAGEGEASAYRFDLDLNLQESWGERTNSGSPDTGEFWGPRRFVATRRENELIVIDQKDNDTEGDDPDLDGTGRLVRFRFGTIGGWQAFGAGEFGFFDTKFDTGAS